MKKLFLALSIVIGHSACAQNTSFFRSFNNDSADLSVDAFQKGRGDYYLLSNTNSAGHLDFQVTKTNGLGLALWSFTYGGSRDDMATAMAPTADNGVVICGYTEGLTSARDAFVTKINSAGVVQWSRTILTDSVEQFSDITESINGDIYATGFTNEDTTGLNVLVARLTNSGSVVWANHYGGAGDDIGSALIEDQLGRIMVVGSTMNDSVTIGPTGDKDISILTLNSGGSLLACKNVGTASEEYATTILQESANEYVVGGNIGLVGGNRADGFLISLDTNLTLSNGVYFGLNGNDNIEDVKSIGGGSLMVASVSESSFGTITSLVFEVSFSNGVQSALSVGGMMNDGGGSTSITGSVGLGYSLYSSGKSFGNTNSNDLYLSKLNAQNSVACIPSSELLDFGSLNFLADTFSTNSNALSSNSAITYVRKTVFNSDTTFCCQLEAKVSADTITICDGEIANLGRPSISGYQYNWTATGYTSTSSNPSVSPTKSIEYKLVVSSSDGLCVEDSSLVYVRVNPRRNVTPLSDTFFCKGSAITLNGPSGMIFYEWDGTSGKSSSSAREQSIEDTLSLRFIDQNSCVYYDTLAVLQKSLPVFSLGNDTVICENFDITIKGPSGMASYTWNGVISSIDSFTTNVPQVHTLDVIDSFGCEFQDEVQVLTNPISPFDVGQDTAVCEGESVVFFGNGALTNYKWNGMVTNKSSFTATSGGTIVAEAYNRFGCPSFDTVQLLIIPLPTFSLGNDTGACDNISLQLRGPSGLKSYTWFNGTNGQTFNVSGPGLYYLEVESQDDCIYIDSMEVTVYTSPTISLGSDTSLRTQEPLLLTPGAGYETYQWSTGELTESILVKDKGSYSVTVTDSNGCTGTDEMEILSAASTFTLDGVSYSVHPNPVANVLYLTSNGATLQGTIQLIDNQGRVILETYLNGSSTIDLSSVASGRYTLFLNTAHTSAHFNVIVKR
jgi:hypothetical protein